MERELILSIETAVHGGSLSLMANQTEIGEWKGVLKISRAEDVLEQISNLLISNDFEKSQIKIIGISKGAGSLTGEKIGSALGRGLAKSINCKLIEIDIFEALLTQIKNLSDGDYVTAVPNGKNQVQWQQFAYAKTSFQRIDGVKVSGIEEFSTMIKNKTFERIILASSFREFNDGDLLLEFNKYNVGAESLAKLIATKIASDNGLSV